VTITEARTPADESIEATLAAADEVEDATRSRAGQVRDALEGAVDHVPDVIEGAKAGAERVVRSLPDAAERARHGVEATTTKLQTLPDPTLRMVAVASVALATGLQLAGAPRLVTVLALVPALLAGGALTTRPGAMPATPAGR
jgi:hypothetical protein